jgi:hypothetical protein
MSVEGTRIRMDERNAAREKKIQSSISENTEITLFTLGSLLGILKVVSGEKRISIQKEEVVICRFILCLPI